MHRLIIGLVVALALVGCARAGASVVPSANGSAADGAPDEPSSLADALTDAGLLYSCGGHAFTPDVLSEPGRAEEGDSPESVTLREFLASGMMETEFLPETGWILVGIDGQRASFVAPSGEGASFAEVQMEGTDGVWRVAGWGGCTPRVTFEDANPSTWVLDLTTGVPGPDATEFVAHVTETSCASGQSSRGRVHSPIIVYTSREVVVTFPIEPPPGDGQECPSNPSTAGVVTLDEPLGNRALLDGGTYPPGDPTAPDE